MCSVILFWSVTTMSAEQFGLFTYEVIGGSVTITDYPGDEVGEVEIPVKIGGTPVTTIGDSAFRQCSGMTEITLPPGITSISNYTSARCIGLTAITIHIFHPTTKNFRVQSGIRQDCRAGRGGGGELWTCPAERIEEWISATREHLDIGAGSDARPPLGWR
jgi:hypothetical protein